MLRRRRHRSRYGDDVQVAAGLACIVFGMLHFADRARTQDARRHFYIWHPSSETGRAVLATLECGVGFGLLFTA